MKPIADMTTDEAAFELQRRIAASAPAAVSGSLVDAKNVNQHKCVRLLIDVPVEKAGEVMAAFGWPTMANPIPVAIARLDLSKASGEISRSPEEEPGGGEEPSRRARADAEKKRWDELPAATQIVLACKDEQFREFLGRDVGYQLGETMAQEVVLREIDAERKRDVLRGTRAFAKWQELYGTFTAERDYGGRAA